KYATASSSSFRSTAGVDLASACREVSSALWLAASMVTCRWHPDNVISTPNAHRQRVKADGIRERVMVVLLATASRGLAGFCVRVRDVDVARPRKGEDVGEPGKERTHLTGEQGIHRVELAHGVGVVCIKRIHADI